MGLFTSNDNTCDICGAVLAPSDRSMHLCKVCQGAQFDEWAESK